jgi:hypothetical protein
MTIKHERAFGPVLLDIWNLDDMKVVSMPQPSESTQIR